MSDERDDDKKEHAGEQIRDGLGMLWRAARGVAVGVKKEMNKTELGRSFQDAGRELARAATNVVGRIAEEVTRSTARPGGHVQEPPPKSDEQPPGDTEAKGEDHGDDEFDGVKAPKAKPTGPTPQDPGFRIMVDDDDKKPR